MKKFAKADPIEKQPFRIKEKVVTVDYVVKATADSPEKILIETELDFSDCTTTDLTRLATKHVVIWLQREFRNADGKTQGDAARWERKVNVKTELVAAERKTADPMAKANAALAKLSDEERAELLKSYTKG